MSLSIVTSPAAISSAYRPLIFQIESTVVTPELQIRGEVFVRPDPDSPFVLKAVKYEKKYMGQAFFIFDVSNILRSQLTFDRIEVNQEPGNITPNSGSIVTYYVKFTEVYYDANGLSTDYLTTTSIQLQAVNAIPQVWEDQSLVDYTITGSSGNSFAPAFNKSFG